MYLDINGIRTFGTGMGNFENINGFQTNENFIDITGMCQIA